MAKIFRRDTLINVTGKKKKNEKNRVRNVFLNFRVKPEEKELIENRIALSGLSKSEFFINSCMHQAIHVTGNVKTFDGIKKQMKVIDEHLCSIEKSDELDIEVLESLRAILEILDSIYGEDNNESL